MNPVLRWILLSDLPSLIAAGVMLHLGAIGTYTFLVIAAFSTLNTWRWSTASR